MSDPTTLSPRRPKKKKMSAIVSHSSPGDPSRLQPMAVHGTLAQRNGTSMVGLRLADLNQQLCTAMFGVVLGEPHHCALTEKVRHIHVISNPLPKCNLTFVVVGLQLAQISFLGEFFKRKVSIYN